MLQAGDLGTLTQLPREQWQLWAGQEHRGASSRLGGGRWEGGLRPRGSGSSGAHSEWSLPRAACSAARGPHGAAGAPPHKPCAARSHHSI